MKMFGEIILACGGFAAGMVGLYFCLRALGHALRAGWKTFDGWTLTGYWIDIAWWSTAGALLVALAIALTGPLLAALGYHPLFALF